MSKFIIVLIVAILSQLTGCATISGFKPISICEKEARDFSQAQFLKRLRTLTNTKQDEMGLPVRRVNKKEEKFEPSEACQVAKPENIQVSEEVAMLKNKVRAGRELFWTMLSLLGLVIVALFSYIRSQRALRKAFVAVLAAQQEKKLKNEIS